MPAQRPVELEEVPLPQRGPDRLPQLVLGDRVQARPVRRSPGSRRGSSRRRTRRRGTARGPAAARRPRTRGAPRRPRPAASRRRRAPASASSPRRPGPAPRRRRGPARPAGRGPRRSTGSPSLQRIQRPASEPAPASSAARTGREVPAGVVEDAVEQHPDPPLAAGGDERVEVAVVAQPGVDAEVVGGVVAVGPRGEDRSQRQPVRAQRDEVVQPPVQPAQLVRRRAARRPARFSAPTKPSG